METKSNNLSLKFILGMIAIGIWAVFLQNAGVIPTNQNVKVVNEVDARVRGSVNADVSGNVRIDNTVDINIEKINGKSNVFYRDTDGAYMLLPVVIR